MDLCDCLCYSSLLTSIVLNTSSFSVLKVNEFNDKVINSFYRLYCIHPHPCLLIKSDLYLDETRNLIQERN